MRSDLPGLADALRDWVDAGLIEAEQAAAIRAHEAARASAEPSDDQTDDEADDGLSTAAEVTGYVGAALSLSAGWLIVRELWDQLAPWAQVALTTLLTLGLVGAGWALRQATAGATRRLVNVLWAAAVAATMLTGGVALESGLLVLDDRVEALAVTTPALLLAAALYRLRRTTPQQIAVAVLLAAWSLMVLAAPDVAVETFFYGLLLWAVGVAWLLLAAGGWLEPGRTGQALGLLGVLLGSQVAVVDGPGVAGFVLALASSAAVLVLRARSADLMWLGFGFAGLLLFVPQAVFHFFGDSLGAPLALLVTGLLIVISAVGIAPLRRSGGAG